MSKPEFETVEEALAYMVECAMATQSNWKGRSSVAKYEQDRIDRIVRSGVFAAHIFKLNDAAEKVRCPRLTEALSNERGTPDRAFYTAAEALCWMVECEMATVEGLKGLKRTSKKGLDRHESIVATGLAACVKFDLKEAAHKARCSRVEGAI